MPSDFKTFSLQSLNLSEEELSIREVDFIDIVNDPIESKHYKEEEVSLGHLPLISHKVEAITKTGLTLRKLAHAINRYFFTF